MKKVFSWIAIACFLVGTVLAVAQESTQGDQRLQQRLYREVHHELVMIPQLSIFDNLAYKVDGGTVTLLGQVHEPFLKDQAADAVKHIEGVEKVNNQIEVLPLSPNDDRIRLAVAHAIFNDPRLFNYSIQSLPPIRIIVKNGHVNLEGVVRDQGDKDTAGIRANGVPGVFSVQNNLQVENQKQAQK